MARKKMIYGKGDKVVIYIKSQKKVVEITNVHKTSCEYSVRAPGTNIFIIKADAIICREGEDSLKKMTQKVKTLAKESGVKKKSGVIKESSPGVAVPVVENCPCSTPLIIGEVGNSSVKYRVGDPVVAFTGDRYFIAVIDKIDLNTESFSCVNYASLSQYSCLLSSIDVEKTELIKSKILIRKRIHKLDEEAFEDKLKCANDEIQKQAAKILKIQLERATEANQEEGHKNKVRELELALSGCRTMFRSIGSLAEGPLSELNILLSGCIPSPPESGKSLFRRMFE